MAFYDFDGKITIEESAANNDINKINAAREILIATKASIEQLAQQAAQNSGKTANAIFEKAQELIKKIAKLIQALEESSGYIRRTVVHYQELDRAVKAAIEAAKLSADGGN